MEGALFTVWVGQPLPDQPLYWIGSLDLTVGRGNVGNETKNLR